MGNTIVAPSLFAAQSDNYGAAAALVERGGARYLHIDVMDGHFVPNLSFGPNIVEGLRAKSGLYFDVHLMIEYPERYIPAFIKSGADCVTIHPEAAGDVDESLRLCREHGADFGIALKPGTSLDAYERYYPQCAILLIMSIEPGFGGQAFMPSAPERIAQAKRRRGELNAGYKISVDGGINKETGALCTGAGADILVAGSALFRSEDTAKFIRELAGE